MIDIHCHILHGIDDGADSMAESVAMARIAYEDGVRDIIATPHFNSLWRNEAGLVRRKTAELQRKLDQAGIAVTIHPGNEVRLENKAAFMRDTEQGAYCYLDDAGRFVLLEQRWAEYDPDTPELVAWLLARGTTPIVPHPERHQFFRERPELVERIAAAGAWLQVSADSLTGRSGDDVQRFANWLVDRDLAHTLATDAHNVNRKPNLSEGFRRVRERAGQERADQIARRMAGILQRPSAAD